jgi:hypothetical protein
VSGSKYYTVFAVTRRRIPKRVDFNKLNKVYWLRQRWHVGGERNSNPKCHCRLLWPASCNLHNEKVLYEPRYSSDFQGASVNTDIEKKHQPVEILGSRRKTKKVEFGKESTESKEKRSEIINCKCTDLLKIRGNSARVQIYTFCIYLIFTK